MLDIETIKFLIFLATSYFIVARTTATVLFSVNSYIKNLIAETVRETVSKEIEKKLADLAKNDRCTSSTGKQRKY